MPALLLFLPSHSGHSLHRQLPNHTTLAKLRAFGFWSSTTATDITKSSTVPAHVLVLAFWLSLFSLATPRPLQCLLIFSPLTSAPLPSALLPLQLSSFPCYPTSSLFRKAIIRCHYLHCFFLVCFPLPMLVPPLLSPPSPPSPQPSLPPLQSILPQLPLLLPPLFASKDSTRPEWSRSS